LSAGRRLEQYLSEVRRRLQAVVVARASAVVALTALLVTVGAVFVLRNPGFPPGQVMVARIALVVALVVAAVAMLWRPLNALRVRNQSRTFEKYLPAQSGRIETYLEQARRRDQGEETPLIELLAEDALALADQEPVDKVVPPARLWVPAAAAIAGFVVLAALLTVGRGEWGFGTRNLWFGTPIPREQLALRQIAVTPGDATVRRNQDVPIRAALSGFKAERAEVFVRFGNSKEWERAPMKAGEDGKFDFTLYALREPLSYYVAANGTKSAEHHIDVVDAPRIERMRLTYHYPSWTGLEQETDEVNRDIRAVAGTRVDVELQTTVPLDQATLLVDDFKSGLKTDGAWTRGVIEVKKPGHYRISARVGDELVPLTDEHEISIVEDQQPTVEFAKPARDWQASSIEEVPIEVHARDDFRVNDVELHYSVNGGDWKVAKLKGTGKDVTGNTVLRLEEIGEQQAKTASKADGHDPARLTPGDLVTYYAVAKDRKQSVQTDLFLIHVQPFERRFTQGQAGGMQGGGGDDQQNAISQRQREILLATWNLKRQRDRDADREKERLEQNARMLSDAQGTLAEQAQTLIERAAARGVDNADPKNRELIENLQEAAKAMQPAAKNLGDIKLAEAIPSEQKALQHLMRAEALYTDIEVQFRNSMAGGGGGQQAGRDLAEMFELEMDLDKNQYETQSRAAGNQPSQQLEDALRKLRELAQRQERLAREAARQQQQPRESERWKQEQLRRETEDLRKRLEQLAQQQNSNSPSSQGQGQGQSSGGQPSSQQESARQALNQVEQALRNMQGGESGSQSGSDQSQNSGSPSSGGQSGGKPSTARAAQLASRDLQQALDKLEQGRRQGMAGSFEDLARRAQQMLEQQRRGERELLNAFSGNNAQGGQPGSAIGGPGRRGGLSWERAEALAEEKRSLQAQLDELQRDMQTYARQHREDAPEATKKLGAAASDLAESNLSAGLARSALELERGRGLQAATRERLITEAMENLESDLNQAARVAANEVRRRSSEKNEATPEELLAELSELRRAWAQAQADALARARNGAGPNGERLDPNDPRARGPNGEPIDPRALANRAGARNPSDPRLADRNAGGQRPGVDPSGDPNAPGGRDKASGQQGQSGGEGQQSGDSSSGSSSQGGANAGGRFANNAGPNNGGGYGAWWGGGADYGYRGPYWGAWNPPLPANGLPPSRDFRMQAEDIARRLRDMLNRMPQDALSPADLNALRQLVGRLRRNSDDPMEAEYKKMGTLVDQLELAALNATEKNRPAAPTHTETPATDSPEYRETVAEYYRRLGGTK
jgi:hypothetical protein